MEKIMAYSMVVKIIHNIKSIILLLARTKS